MSANVDKDGNVRQLDRRPEPDENVTELAVKEPSKLARFLLRLFRDVSTLKRRWAPRHIDFEKVVDVSVVSPQVLILSHGLDGPVRWWVVRATNATTLASGLGSSVIPLVVETPSSTENVLFLQVYYSATITIRVEESG